MPLTLLGSAHAAREVKGTGFGVHLRVLLADDDHLIRRCLRRLLEQHADIDVIGECSAGDDLLGAIAALRPDRVLVGVQLPGSAGLDLIRKIKGVDPDVCVVVQSLYADQLTEALRAGAGHYLLKACPMEDLVRALRKPCCERPRMALSAQGVL